MVAAAPEIIDVLVPIPAAAVKLGVAHASTHRRASAVVAAADLIAPSDGEQSWTWNLVILTTNAGDASLLLNSSATAAAATRGSPNLARR